MNPALPSPGAPLRILHLNSLLTGGGTDDQCVKLAVGLRQLGQTVFVAGPGGRQFGEVMAEGGVTFVDTGKNANKFQFIRRVARLIQRERIQIVHGHHGRDLWLTVLAARLSGARPKIVLTRHLAKSPSSWASRHFLLGQCDAMIAVSEFVAKVMRDGVNEPASPEEERRVRPPLRGDHRKIIVIYGGVDTGRFCPREAGAMRRELGLAPEHFGFAVVGGYDLPRGKGQREFLRAAALMHQQIPDARFLIIGRGSMSEVLQADIQQLGLTGKAWLTSYANDMPAVMNAIDCLVHPQIGTEALGLVICEAHACGKPVIASNLDGIPEAFRAGNYGRLVRPENVEELAEAMRMQAAQPKRDTASATALHTRVAGVFSLSILAQNVFRLYADLIKPVSPAPFASPKTVA